MFHRNNHTEDKKDTPDYISIKKVLDLIQDIPLEIAFFDPSGRYKFVNERYIADPIIRRKIIGRKEKSYIELMEISSDSLKKREEMFQQALREKKVLHFTEKLYIPKQKKTLFYKRTLKPLFLNEKDDLLAGIFLFGTDISSTIRGQKEVKYMAYHDLLTGLKNRYAFNEYLDLFISDTEAADKSSPFYILYCDLDNFRVINESLGHEIGDKVLKEISSRIKLCLTNMDHVFRIGGNEFAIALRNCANTDEVQAIAEKIIYYLSSSYNIDGNHLSYLTCSIGIVSYPLDGEDKQKLMKNANIALYNAKRKGENTFQYFSQKMTDSAHRILTIKENMHALVDNKTYDDHFEVHYQPIIEKASDGTYRIAGAEALLRWYDPKIGAIDPGQFIPIAEETNLIPVIGEWVYRKVFSDFNSLVSNCKNPPYLSINFSTKQFRVKNLYKKIIKELERFNIEPRHIQLEITETNILDEHYQVKENIEALIQHGFRLAIDDFGVGYASLAYLHKIPAHAVKIDKSFIKLLGTSEKYQKLVKSIIMMGENLGKDIIAEGVERTEDLYLLDSFGCTKFQGYLFSQPLNLQDFKAYLHEENLLTTLIYSV
ncbi:MAG: bifunctional diguanylate cyclase/phosphodiesterase [Calditrichaceae bacterium]|nr:bifunctional diguanylate cyclase/phosphodiesterase [Calditrichaceae bacterium]MBN2710276.1 bifunctional diguanylate cyclase/phosphodiesterase [Calditrichaceae bacterium]RQV93896.1 MAG: bifunctional diguanylate cyclase/phosphodiesterase [Calditrichota bacterium]